MRRRRRRRRSMRNTADRISPYQESMRKRRLSGPAINGRRRSGRRMNEAPLKRPAGLFPSVRLDFTVTADACEDTVNAPSKDARLPLGYLCVLASAARP